MHPTNNSQNIVRLLHLDLFVVPLLVVELSSQTVDLLSILSTLVGLTSFALTLPGGGVIATAKPLPVSELTCFGGSNEPLGALSATYGASPQQCRVDRGLKEGGKKAGHHTCAFPYSHFGASGELWATRNASTGAGK